VIFIGDLVTAIVFSVCKLSPLLLIRYDSFGLFIIALPKCLFCIE
jgi:hypothetical protein